MQELHSRLIKDLSKVGVKTDFTLVLRPYSKTYYGRYDPNKNVVTLYVYQDPTLNRMYSYETLLLTLIHEAVHCIQWHDNSFVRVRGIMHDEEFYRLYGRYSDRARAYLLSKEIDYECKQNAISKPKWSQCSIPLYS